MYSLQKLVRLQAKQHLKVVWIRGRILHKKQTQEKDVEEEADGGRVLILMLTIRNL